MKKNKTIEKLSEDWAFVAKPVPESIPWTNWRQTLRDVLEENDLGRGWEESTDYDFRPVGSDAPRTWRTTFDKTFTEIAVVGGFKGSFSIHVEIDPSKGVANEIERVQGLLGEFRGACARSVHEADLAETLTKIRATA